MLSHLNQMPDLTRLQFPARLVQIRLEDATIFRALRDAHRQLTDRQGAACPGDYLLVRAQLPGGHDRTLHLELGAGHFPDYEQALTGCRAGQTLSSTIHGDPAVLQVLTVRQVVELPLTDASIAALGLPGIATLADYRRDFIRRHGLERANRIFEAARSRLVEQMAGLLDATVDPQELADYHRQQREMIGIISGDTDKRLMEAYPGDTPEACDRMFLADNRRSFLISLWGTALAEQDGRSPTSQEQARLQDSYRMIHGPQAKPSAQDLLRPFFIQYAIARLRSYYLSLVRISAKGLDALPLYLDEA